MSNDNLKFSLCSIVEKKLLNETNFLDWEMNLRIILRSEGREDVLTTLIPTVTGTSSDEEKATSTRVKTEALPVTCLMLAAMEPELQKRFLHSDDYTIITELKMLFKNQARIERYETHTAILDSKLVKGKPVSPHVISLTGLFKRMENLGTPYDQELATDIVLRSLHDEEGSSKCQQWEGVAKKKNNNQGKGKQVAKPKGGEKPMMVADHDCFYCKGLRNKRQVKKGEIDLRVGNGASVAALTVGDLSLSLPSGLIL
ncbi:uncharacterized protein LOC124914374 [Impatiens glandulifera]|uniref:uncharacterized protein LOC124914374 n=1 Tax=Impatiens glandulifera TaxID=253017 RepID=UPI001FB05C6D|nr:uncharacterized protein LOC124914374 [Impatiens glandulifera]